MTDMFMDKGAEFSDDRKYRYALYRIWDKSLPCIMFIGLNPSTANENSDDPTIRRVKTFAADWGYGGVYMTNLFGWVTAYPEELRKCPDPLGENDWWLKEIAESCGDIVFAWGSFPEAHERGQQVAKMFPDAFCLGKTKEGHPKHPLYLKKDTKRIMYN